mmetsp:Transcript_75968/g.219380  ORF Transcript_75968/g.219380 Transcript_75968/m.219380 type:complete len:249 (+) Transcript_75968:74-820(+)
MATNWQKVLIAAGGVAGACALLYILKKQAAAGQAGGGGRRTLGASLDAISTEKVHSMLQEIIETQSAVKAKTKEIIRDLSGGAMDLESAYRKVQAMMPPDPLEKHGLSMMEFDQLIERHQGDGRIREAIGKIMGAPSLASGASAAVQGIDVKKIVELHSYMLEELEQLAKDFQALRSKGPLDMKAVTVAAQAIVNAKCEGKFGITAEDIEGAVMLHHRDLATNQEFSAINIKIQHTMGQLMGTPFAPN